MTKGELISDIELRLTAGKPSDDSEVERDQIAAWLDDARAMLINDYYDKQYAGDVIEQPSLITRKECNTVALEQPACIADECYASYYLSIPRPLQLRYDHGIVSVHYPNGRPISRMTNPTEYNIYKHLRFGKPKEGWYRIGSKLYLIGKKYSTNYTFHVDLILADTTTLSDSDEYPVDERMIPAMKELAGSIGAQQLGIQPDLVNDGKA